MKLAAIDCGLPVPVLVTDSVALRAPLADGANATPNWQLPPAGTTDPLHRLLTIGNSPALELATADTVTAALPMLVSVTVDGALCEPTVVPGRETATGIDSWPGVDETTLPVPDSATVLYGTPRALVRSMIPDIAWIVVSIAARSAYGEFAPKPEIGQ